MITGDPHGYRGGINEELARLFREEQQRRQNVEADNRFLKIVAWVCMLITFCVLQQQFFPHPWNQLNATPAEPTTDASVFEPETTMVHEVREFQLQVWVRAYWLVPTMHSPRRWPGMSRCGHHGRCRCTQVHRVAAAQPPFHLTN